MSTHDAFSAEEMAVLRPIFLESAREHLTSMSLITKEMEEGQPDACRLETLHRSVHSLKGAALQLGFETLGRSASRLEQVLLRVRDARDASPPAGWLDLVRRGLPLFERAVEQIASGNAEESDEVWSAALEVWLAIAGERGGRSQAAG
ncbi:MAG: Hpt domain-containing protein [Candidatus Eisenbacteria bacterium]